MCKLSVTPHIYHIGLPAGRSIIPINNGKLDHGEETMDNRNGNGGQDGRQTDSFSNRGL